jgi:peptidyl-Asp metalloendopeptidase
MTRIRDAARLIVISLGIAWPLMLSPTQAAEPSRDTAAQPLSRVIISIDPKQRSRLHWYLRRVSGKTRGERIGLGQSEVWAVPTEQLSRLAFLLRVFGSRLTQIPTDFNHLFQWTTDPLPSTRDEMFKNARATPSVIGIGMMRAQQATLTEYALLLGADTPALARGAPPDKIASAIIVPISATRQVTIQRLRVVNTDRGTTWRGNVTESGESALVMWWKDRHLSGMFAYEGHIYTIVNAGAGVYAVIESDPAKIPSDHSPATSDGALLRPGDEELAEATSDEAPPPVTPFSDERRRALEAKEITIDLMMLYTKRAASRYLLGPNDLLELAVEQANETFRNSAIPNVSLRLVHAEAVDYDEADAAKFDTLYRLVDGDGVFKDVRRLRDEKRADVVGLMLEDPNDCGLSTRVGASSEEAFFVVHHACATLTNSIAHEVGHIMGARHDRSIDKQSRPFPYGHGYVNAKKWRDIMSYNRACNGCPRIPFWSNPRVMYQGEPTGTKWEDNARVILEQAERVSKFR